VPVGRCHRIAWGLRLCGSRFARFLSRGLARCIGASWFAGGLDRREISRAVNCASRGSIDRAERRSDDWTGVRRTFRRCFAGGFGSAKRRSLSRGLKRVISRSGVVWRLVRSRPVRRNR
jgi:hypothetical protein